MKRLMTKSVYVLTFMFMSATMFSCITAKEAPKSYGSKTKTSKEQKKSMKKSHSQSVKKMKNAGKYNPKTDF